MKIKRTIITTILYVMISLCTVFTVNGAEAEYVMFGVYPQSEVTKTPTLENAYYDENGDAVIEENKYRRVKVDSGFKYFLYEPVKWQKKGNTLVSVMVLDCKMYDEQEEKVKNFMGGVKYADSVTWEECSLRKWLNNDFVATAFDEGERSKILGEVRLLTVDEAKSMETSELCKNATGYAISGGIEPRKKGDDSGDTEWFLKDISPIVSSTVCTVENSGKINTGMTVLVNEPDIGIVPCIMLNDFSGISSHSEKLPEKKIELYYPGGRTLEFAESKVPEAVANGWYQDKAAAMNVNALSMKERFAASSLNSSYKWRLYNRSGKNPYISIDAEKENMTIPEIIAFVKPVMDTFYTGNMEDNMEVHFEFVYDDSVASSYDDFSDTIGESVHDAAEACWSGTGNIICSDGGMGRLTGTSGAKHTVTLRLKINSDGNYSVNGTNYNNTLHTLALEAKAYSSRPVGQLQYLRHYFGQNTIYDGRQFNNEPTTLVTSGVGICGTYANFTADFCKLLGIPCVVYTNEKAMHAWNGVYIDGKWYQMDHTGNSDKEYMRNFYSNYMADNEPFSFNPNGFPAEHNAENVDFLVDEYLPIDNLSPQELVYVNNMFATNQNTVTAKTPPVYSGASEQKEITVLINGQKISFDVNPVIENGRTLVPMRKIFEALGATVYWNNDTRTAMGVRGIDVISITVNSDVMTKNGENITLDVPARLINSRTLVPVRVIAESFGLSVSWDGVNRTVIIE